MSGITHQKPLIKHPDEDITYAVDMTASLGTETVSTVDSVDSDTVGLTIDTLAANAGTLAASDGDAIAIGKAATFDISGGADGVDYILTVTMTTSGGATRVAVVKLQVRNGLDG